MVTRSLALKPFLALLAQRVSLGRTSLPPKNMRFALSPFRVYSPFGLLSPRRLVVWHSSASSRTSQADSGAGGAVQLCDSGQLSPGGRAKGHLPGRVLICRVQRMTQVDMSRNRIY